MGALNSKMLNYTSGILLGATPQLLAANQKVAKRMRKLSVSEISSQDPRAAVPLEKVQEYHENELSRRKALEDKAKTNVTAVTIAISVLFSGLTVVGNDKIIATSGAMRSILICALIFCVANFVLGGLFAMRTLQAGPLQSLSLNHELLDEKERVGILLRAIDLNEMDTMIRYNWLSASYRCIKNAVFALSSFVVIVTMHILR